MASVEPLKLPATGGLIDHLFIFPVLERQHSWQRSVYVGALGFMQAASVTEGCAGAP